MGSKEDTPDREIARSLFLAFSLCLSVSVVKLRIEHGLDSAIRCVLRLYGLAFF